MNGRQPYRLERGGALDRDRPVEITFDGHRYRGFAGDTLASLLLANGVRLMGRSFKYHRPRGVLAAGPEEPNALVELGTGARREPNTRATLVEARDGLVAASQNRYPSLRFDLLSVNGLLHRFLVAGFYYKTFMWPARFWESVYERRIRAAAGLGRAAGSPDPDRYEHVHHHTDVLIAGAGPAGLMAALTAASSGARVTLLEASAWLGGRLGWERETLDGRPAAAWVESVAARLASMDNVRVLRRTTLTSVHDHGVTSALEQVAGGEDETDPALPRQRLWVIRSACTVFANGGFERPLVFDDNDRPGVMLASAVRTYLNRFAVAPGRRFLVATNNDDAYRTAFDLAAAGCQVVAVADARAEPGAVAARAREQGLRVYTGALPARALGGRALRGVRLQGADGKVLDTLSCDCLAVSGGYTPDVSLASQCGPAPVWDAARAAFLPGKQPPGFRTAGGAAGVDDLAGCLASGAEAGEAAVREAGFEPTAAGLPAVEHEAVGPVLPVWRCPGSGKAFVDFQNDVTAGDIHLADQEGFRSVEHLKRYTTLGMGTDQGKTSSVNGIGLLAAVQGRPISEVGTTRFRPPAVPVAIGAYAGHRRGASFVPTRRTAMDRWHRRHGAEFIEAGQWLRPAGYPRDGEDIAASTWREALAVRESVGMCDVSTLGKIDVMGPDAAEFLTRLYINGFHKLAVGRVRYGAMLRADGHLLDDGTTSRFAGDHFVTTTTTANAARVLAHMEYHAQVAWPDLDVAVCSATEQWATMAVAGPCSRDTLQRAFPDGDLSNEALPFMGYTELRGGAFPVRIFRISFSGELAYEVSVPWGFGEATWSRIMSAGREFGITPYGTEALSVLRIEKGHPAGPEFDGRTTAGDIGLERMVANQKADFVGRVLATREGLADPSRPRLVGLRAIDGSQRLRGGAHLLGESGAPLEESLGWLSSVSHSPHVGSWIALGFLRNGAERMGDTLQAVFPLLDEAVSVEVCQPCFLDPEGSRLRG